MKVEADGLRFKGKRMKEYESSVGMFLEYITILISGSFSSKMTQLDPSLAILMGCLNVYVVIHMVSQTI